MEFFLMTGGFSRPAWRVLILAVFALFALSGCSLLWGPQQAPIVDATVMPVEPASAPVAASAPEPVEAEANEPEQPKKPKKPVEKPHKVEPPPPVATPAPPPPPPPPPPLIVLRTIERNEARALLDSEVQKPDGKVVGRAVDVIADALGKPREMVVNLQGFLGVGDRKVNFPWSAFRFTPTAKTAPIMLNAGAVPASAVKSNAVQLPLIDATVERSNGAKVGRVIDVLIDANAQPQAVVLDVNGMVSTERRTIAANWSALHFVTRDKELHPLLELSDAQINATPLYASDKPIRAVSPAPPPAPAPAPASAPAAASAPGGPSTAIAVSNARAAR
jgi:sporulation protein YlmC with PRC-barrel domain